MTLNHSSSFGCRYSRIVGHHGESVRSSSQRQSGTYASSSQTGLPIAPASGRWHLAVPPLALLSIAWLVLLLATLGLFLLHGSAVPLWICITTGSILMGAILLAWHRFGREVLPLGSLLLVPWYVLGKLPIYAGFFIGRRSGWMRTVRAGEVQ